MQEYNSHMTCTVDTANTVVGIIDMDQKELVRV